MFWFLVGCLVFALLIFIARGLPQNKEGDLWFVVVIVVVLILIAVAHQTDYRWQSETLNFPHLGRGAPARP